MAALAALVLLALLGTAFARPSWHADVRVTPLSGPRPAPGSPALWRQCSAVSLRNPADIAGRYGGVLRVEGGLLASADGPAALVPVPGRPGSYALQAADASLGAGGTIDLVTICIDYKARWALKPEIIVEPAEDGYVEVTADGMVVPDGTPVAVQVPTKRLFRRQDMFTADWSSGSCRCINALASLATPLPRPPTPPPPASDTNAPSLTDVEGSAPDRDGVVTLDGRGARISGTADAPQGSLIYLTVDGQWIGTAIADDGGAFEFDAGPVGESGSHELRVSSTPGSSKSYKVVVEVPDGPRLPSLRSVSGRRPDPKDPTSIVAPPNPVFFGLGTPNAGYGVYVDGEQVGQGTAGPDGSFSWEDAEGMFKPGEARKLFFLTFGFSDTYLVEASKDIKEVPPYLVRAGDRAVVGSLTSVSGEKFAARGIAEPAGRKDKVTVYRIAKPYAKPEEVGAAETDERGRFEIELEVGEAGATFVFAGPGGKRAHHFLKDGDKGADSGGETKAGDGTTAGGEVEIPQSSGADKAPELESFGGNTPDGLEVSLEGSASALVVGTSGGGEGTLVYIVVRDAGAWRWVGTAIAGRDARFRYRADQIGDGDYEVVLVANGARSEPYLVSVRGTEKESKMPAYVAYASGRLVRDDGSPALELKVPRDPWLSVSTSRDHAGKPCSVMVDGTEVDRFDLGSGGGAVYDAGKVLEPGETHKIRFNVDGLGEGRPYEVTVVTDKVVPRAPYLLGVNGEAVLGGTTTTGKRAKVLGVAEPPGEAVEIAVYRILKPGSEPERYAVVQSDGKRGLFELEVEVGEAGAALLFASPAGKSVHHLQYSSDGSEGQSN
ncbi:hypothetical protein DFJ74DRAFT_773114 [Hyaloraphidium curvatum]|nr:hypothetical protein DFJ74DRAFT_773114 [Hyaloraphidium curvatum]